VCRVLLLCGGGSGYFVIIVWIWRKSGILMGIENFTRLDFFMVPMLFCGGGSAYSAAFFL